MEWDKARAGEDETVITLLGPTHKLKILAPYFQAILDGSKMFEVRDNADRGFQKGDTVLLQELNGPCNSMFPPAYSGRSLLIEITYVTNWEQKPNYVVFSFVVKSRDKYGFVAGGKKSSEMSREELIDVLLVQASIIDDLYEKTADAEEDTGP
jgi:hypothetical protein